MLKYMGAYFKYIKLENVPNKDWGEENQLTLDSVGMVGDLVGKDCGEWTTILVAKISITGTEKNKS